MATIKGSQRPTPVTRPWNTKDLGKRLGVDAASAATAGALTCPLITIIDRAIMEKASKGFPIQQTITSCLRSMVARPSAFFFSTPFLLIYTLYGSTYLTANAIDTVTATMRNHSYDTIDTGFAKFIATTTVNMAICVYKDARFAKMFGAQPPPSSSSQPLRAPAPTPQIPKSSYTLFCLRDSITIFASFNIPAKIAPSIPDFMASTPGMKASLAQFACPALMQFASTPMHLLGLDLYNRQPEGGLRWTDRASRIRRDYVASCFARMGKIVPAYGIGGTVNVRMRSYLMNLIEGEKITI
ncbi:unnamed protein product [Penicillium salamii]|uniref:Sequence orphan n=1 Tax=Penicillium salamii TaxID=1612424 RepID=A0A9W4N0D0_9EURO|nr:unnamed protein product [Penicillium salamii]CAG8013641.1 unnamed protein product [Penicillium salamii]CAG8172079.1 unnamed protein product [Penicillium salamii]CAG8242428.1 unnamed protein product [Penicillium salamii]CAG8255459.1 unnamed protein product [Penicillium salamii]